MGKQCFIICPFGDPKSDTRKRSDRLLKYIIEPAVSTFDYSVDRADLSNEPGIVTIYVIRNLYNADLVIADLTDSNPNVFYELAIRHTTNKPCIQLLTTPQKVPFNIQEMQTISYDLDDIAEIAKSIESIKKQVQYFENGGGIVNPVTTAVKTFNMPQSKTAYSTKSASYVEVCNELIHAHFDFNNFQNEVEPARKLAELGADCPPDVLSLVVEAFLVSYIGNRYGTSPDALKYLEEFRWGFDSRHYTTIVRCITESKYVRSQLNSAKPFERYKLLLKEILPYLEEVDDRVKAKIIIEHQHNYVKNQFSL